MGEADGVVWGVVWIVQQQSNVRTLRMLVLLIYYRFNGSTLKWKCALNSVPKTIRNLLPAEGRVHIDIWPYKGSYLRETESI